MASDALLRAWWTQVISKYNYLHAQLNASAGVADKLNVFGEKAVLGGVGWPGPYIPTRTARGAGQGRRNLERARALHLDDCVAEMLAGKGRPSAKHPCSGPFFSSQLLYFCGYDKARPPARGDAARRCLLLPLTAGGRRSARVATPPLWPGPRPTSRAILPLLACWTSMPCPFARSKPSCPRGCEGQWGVASPGLTAAPDGGRSYFDGLSAFAQRPQGRGEGGAQNNVMRNVRPPSPRSLAFVQKTMADTGETEFYEFVRALFWDKVRGGSGPCLAQPTCRAPFRSRVSAPTTCCPRASRGRGPRINLSPGPGAGKGASTLLFNALKEKEDAICSNCPVWLCACCVADRDVHPPTPGRPAPAAPAPRTACQSSGPQTARTRIPPHSA